MGVAIDQARENRGGSAIQPFDRLRPLAFPKIGVCADLDDPAAGNYDRAVTMAPQGAVGGRVDQISPDSE
jgi:hypothetical protein